jgi:nuclease HARBI1
MNLQGALYSGHKRVFNLLYQLVTTPTGLAMDLAGPYLGKGMDLNALADSEILQRFRAALIAAGLDPNAYDISGDKIYPNVPNLVALYTSPMSDAAAAENVQDAQARVASEHMNCKIGQQWNSLKFTEKQRVQVSQVAKLFIVAVILTNAHTLLEGGQTLQQFTDPDYPNELTMPSLECYFDIAPFAP